MSINRQRKRAYLVGLVLMVLFVALNHCMAGEVGFKIFLENGKVYGPGDRGVFPIQKGYLSNFTVTGHLVGTIPFFNNGADAPNVSAEAVQGGFVDGKLSDGTPINENVNAAFVIKLPDKSTGKTANLFIGSISEERIEIDDHENLMFKLTAAFDPGFAEFVIKLPVAFITGSVAVPLSEKTKRSLPGGQDQAASFKAGTVHVGRVGDYDNDGFMDGTFVLAGNAPFKLLIVEGDPVLLVRPFTSDIPISAKEATYLSINNLHANYSQIISYNIQSQDRKNLKRHLTDIVDRVGLVTKTTARIRIRRNRMLSKASQESLKMDVQDKLIQFHKTVQQTNEHADQWSWEQISHSMNQSFGLLADAHSTIKLMR